MRTGSAVYVDEDGRHERGNCGEVVRVHGDDLARFDRFNVLLGDPVPEQDATPDPEPAEKKSPRTRAKPEE